MITSNPIGFKTNFRKNFHIFYLKKLQKCQKIAKMSKKLQKLQKFALFAKFLQWVALVMTFNIKKIKIKFFFNIF